MNGLEIDLKGKPVMWTGRIAALAAAMLVGNVSPNVVSSHVSEGQEATQVLVRIEGSINRLVDSLDEDLRELQKGQNELLREIIKHHYRD